MKVISIKQPYASLIAYGYKEYEFRTWKTKYRGEIYIHASKMLDKKGMEKYKGLDIEYPTGVIIAKAYLEDCIKINDEFKKILTGKNKPPYIYTHIINGDNNKYAFYMKNIEIINKIEAKGQLGIWNYEE